VDIRGNGPEVGAIRWPYLRVAETIRRDSEFDGDERVVAP
jgi:hypothetical protein